SATRLATAQDARRVMTLSARLVRMIGTRAPSTMPAAAAPGGDFVADREGEFPGDHPGHLIAVAVQMIEAIGTGGQGLLERHDALAGFASEQLHRKEAARCRGCEMLAVASGYDKALCCNHAHPPYGII